MFRYFQPKEICTEFLQITRLYNSPIKHRNLRTVKVSRPAISGEGGREGGARNEFREDTLKALIIPRHDSIFRVSSFSLGETIHLLIIWVRMKGRIDGSRFNRDPRILLFSKEERMLAVIIRK